MADLAILPSLLPSQHLADPAGAITQMTGAKSSTPIAMHCIAIIGVCHAVLGFLYAMFAKVKSEGVRKCSLAIWGAVFLPLCTYAQYAFPATGKAPVGIWSLDFHRMVEAAIMTVDPSFSVREVSGRGTEARLIQEACLRWCSDRCQGGEAAPRAGPDAGEPAPVCQGPPVWE